jgi:hypothetical protein
MTKNEGEIRMTNLAVTGAPPLPLWERHRPPPAAVLKNDAEAKLRLRRVDRCDPGEGFCSIDRPEPLTPTLSHKGRGGSLPPLIGERK